MADENPELKGGHAPAQKVGGMRVVQHKQQEKEEPPKAKMTPEEVEEFGEDNKNKESGGAAPIVVSGAKVSVNDAFPTQAVKAIHEKPKPTHEKGAPQKPNMVLQQPRKQ